ncbi:outer membrane beta-barrel protein [Desulfoluna sp.]|uniref:outer membrane beta-barrel protein n=1 Tax=Desulfoluna sp. TaxID=2045199 RepID=UPI00260C7E80|nr:outer membrane beta-barrel protein [Desulfoluna sp.]
MKRVIFAVTAILMMLGQTALASEGNNIRIAAGPSLFYDSMNQEAGAGGYLDLGYRLTPSVAIELHGAMSDSFGVDNDLTRGDASVRLLTLGGRYMSDMGDASSGYISMGVGVLEIEAEEMPSGSDDTRSGGVARFGVGVDFPITSQFGVTCGAGFNRGFGATDEVILFDFTTGLFCTF